MAYTSTVTDSTVFGNKRVNFGTFAISDTATTAIISHGLKKLDSLDLVLSGTATTWKLDSAISSIALAGTAAVTFGTATCAGTFTAIGK